MRILMGWMNQVFDPREAGFDVVTMGRTNCDIVYDDARMTMADLALPAGWKPDVVIWFYPEFFPPPPDLENLGCPLVVVFGDWNLGFNADLLNAPRFSHAFSDRLGAHIFRQYGVQHIDEWTTYSLFAHFHAGLPQVPKHYDVSFVGNLSSAIQGERNRWLRRLARFGRDHRVLITTQVFGEDYTRLLYQSRIVFNRTIRNELNMRCYEALAVGALLFLEEDNVEAPAYLEDGVHCVYYNDANFEERLGYYIEHPEACEAIAAAGHLKWRELTYTTTLPQLFSKVQALWEAGALKPGRRSWSAMAQYYFNTRLPNALLQAERLIDRAKSEGEREQALTLRAVFEADRAGREGAAAVREAEKACLTLLGDVPQDPVGRYRLAEMLLMQARSTEGRAVLTRLCRDLEEDGLLDRLACANQVHCAFEPLRSAWERVTFLAMGDRRALAEGRRDLLLAAVLSKLAVELRESAPLEAVANLGRSLTLWPSQADKRFLLAQLYWALNNREQALHHQQLAYGEVPFQLEEGSRLASWFMQAGHCHEALQCCQELLGLTKVVPHLESQRPPLLALQESILDMQRIELSRPHV